MFLPLQIPVLKWLLLLTIDNLIYYDYDAIRTVVDTRGPLGIYKEKYNCPRESTVLIDMFAP
jgi:hypothetical protein